MPTRPFKPYMGKNTFGELKESKEAGEYILKKKAITTFCSPNVCTPSRTVVTQSNRLLLKKANAIYSHGIARCLELIIYQEEQLFKDTLATAAGFEKPVQPEAGVSPEEESAYQDALKQYNEQIKKVMMALVEAKMVPPGVKGLIPDGDITVFWRWMGPVYEESTQDILNNSIVVRNLQELGVDSIEALKYLFPSKTDEERAEMLSGFPFRMVNELQGAFSQLSRLVGGMMQTPHPQAPDLPMAADPRLDLTPYLYRTLEALQKEMSYAGRYRPIDPTDEPSTSSGSKQLRDPSVTSGSLPSGNSLPPSSAPDGTSGGYQLPISAYSVRPPIPTGGTEQQPMGVGVQQSSEPAGDPGAIPIPGTVLATSQSDSVYPGELRTSQQPSYATIGSADLVNKPDLLAQLFPNFLESLLGRGSGSAPVESGKPDGGRRVRNGSSGNPKQLRAKSGGNAGQRGGMGPRGN